MKIVLKYLKPYWLLLIVAIGLLAVQATGELTLPDYMSKIVDIGISKGGIDPNATPSLIDHTVTPEDRQISYILNAGGQMLLIAFLIMTAVITENFLASKIATGIARDLRKAVFEKVVSFSHKEFDTFSTASLITRTTNDIQQVQNLTVMMLRFIFYAPIIAVGGVIKIVNSEAQMSWILVVGVSVIAIIFFIAFKVAMPRFKLIQKLVDRVNLVMRESLTGMLVIRAFDNQKYQEEKFDKENTKLRDTNLFVNRFMSAMMPTMFLVMNFITLLIIWVGARYVDMGAIEVGSMMAFNQYAIQVLFSVLMITMVTMIAPRAAISLNRIAEVLNAEVSVKESGDPKKFKNLKGVIEFKNVSFKYPDADEYVIKDVSFSAHPSETTAFIGSTGSGKSTIVNLIPRFYDVTEGEIVIDGVNISDVTLSDLRKKIGYAPQKGLLFSGTVESNLKFSDENMTDENMMKAARIAQADSFIEEFPERYDHRIAQGGSNVSGGQRQRLSIARALAKLPEIFIFDDSFSALDFKTDAALRKQLKEEISDATTLIVAQRISSIVNSDQIIVLDKGRVVGKGKHRELLKNCEVYKQIAYSQLSEEELSYE